MDPTSDSLHGSGAEDWVDLADRMHMILTTEQVQAIAAGHTPDGSL